MGPPLRRERSGGRQFLVGSSPFSASFSLKRFSASFSLKRGKLGIDTTPSGSPVGALARSRKAGLPNQIKIDAGSSPAAVRAHFLSRICVQPPYFALSDFAIGAQEATVNPPGGQNPTVSVTARAPVQTFAHHEGAPKLACPTR